jgi:ribosomal silencing factor RsfS
MPKINTKNKCKFFDNVILMIGNRNKKVQRRSQSKVKELRKAKKINSQVATENK